MPTSLFNFLDSLTSHLRHIGKDQLAFDIKAGYARGTGGVDKEWIISCLANAVDDSDQLAFEFEFPIAA